MKPKKISTKRPKNPKENTKVCICVYCEPPKKVAIEKEEQYLKRAGRSLHIEERILFIKSEE